MMNINKLNKITLIILSCLLIFASGVSAQTNTDKEVKTKKKEVKTKKKTSSKTAKADSAKDSKTAKKPVNKNAQADSAKETKADKESADKTAEKETENTVKLDKKYLKEFTDSVVEQWSKKQIDVLKPFSVELNVVLDDEGKFNKDYTKYLKTEGDKDLIKVAKSGIQAVNDSGYFMYIKNFGISNFKLTFAQDKDAVWAYINTNAESVKEAKAIEKEYDTVIAKIKSETKDITEKFILEQFAATRQELQMTLKFKLPGIVVRQVLNYELLKASDKKILGN